ncbi:MAG TPA: HAD family phosphatase [Candidatus Krumholzibacterium sp.]|nr:HAD family phosphatase [Candidatus Krumholzibacterium sp.]
MADRLERLRALIDGSRAAIFDFDNVIVDSEPFHYRAYSEVFGARGHTIDEDDYWVEWTSKGGGAEKEIKRYGLGFDPLDIRAEKDPLYSSYCESGEIPVFPYAMKVIRSLGASGLVLAIASGSYERDIRALLRYNGIEEMFAAIVGKDGIELTKPHPETYLRAVKALGLGPGDCFAIEDAEKGVIAAHAAGMKVITVETRVTKGFDLGDPDIAFSGLDELYSMMVAAGLRPAD